MGATARKLMEEFELTNDISGDINNVPILKIVPKDPNPEDIYEVVKFPQLPVKVSVEVINPIGIVTEHYDIKYKPADHTGRFILTIGDNQFMVTGNGKSIERVGKNTKI
jgi:hypothetical protein